MSFVHRLVDVIVINVPFLLGLDWLDAEKLCVDNVDNLLVSKKERWHIPLVRKLGLIYPEWQLVKDVCILFSHAELLKLRGQLFHPTAKKFFNLIRRGQPLEANPATRRLLQNINKTCHACRTYAPPPTSFQVTVPKDIVFNKELAIDLMFILGMAMLHIVDTAPHYNSAVFLKGQSTEHIWGAFLETWVMLYIGLPDCIHADYGSVFANPPWRRILSEFGIKLKLSGIESHNALGSGERYHTPLRRIYYKVRDTVPNLCPD